MPGGLHGNFPWPQVSIGATPVESKTRPRRLTAIPRRLQEGSTWPQDSIGVTPVGFKTRPRRRTATPGRLKEDKEASRWPQVARWWQALRRLIKKRGAANPCAALSHTMEEMHTSIGGSWSRAHVLDPSQHMDRATWHSTIGAH